jgi:stearoyl-CoA desaturase (delta-9 desaturase)
MIEPMQAPSPRPTWAERYRAAPVNALAVAMGLAFHGVALAAFTQPFRLRYLALGLVVYLWSMLSTTLYLHRSLTHRGLTLAAPLRAVFALGTATNLLADPVGWVGLHRQHHRASDTDEDVHSPRMGFFFAHAGWATRLTSAMQAEVRALAPDVRRDPLCKAMENPAVYAGMHGAIALAVYAAFGLGGLLWGFYLPVLLSVHATSAVNSVCHLPAFGRRDADTPDDSRNVGWLALPTLGESWHNHHHQAPKRIRHGLGPGELDPTFAVIRLLARLGLATDLYWTGSRNDIETGVMGNNDDSLSDV